MRRFLFLMAMLLATPAFAAGPAKLASPSKPVTQPRLIARIDGLVASAGSGAVVIQAKGAVDSGGWRQGRLRPVKTTAVDAHTIVVEFIATPPPPAQAVIEGLLPITATATLPLRRGVVSVRVVSGSNEITTQILK